MNNGKARSSLFGVVGAYLVYLAYGLYRDGTASDTTMSPAVRILFMVFFAAAGVGLIVWALVLWKRAMDEENHEKQNDPNRMK